MTSSTTSSARGRAAQGRAAARRAARATLPATLPGGPLWFKDAVIYQLHVRAFRDSDGDGRGDFRGLTEKLGYLHDLGVTALWLLPFYPSPLRDDGYDIADYYSVHPSYGTLDDFQTLLTEAHRLGLRVITELVINHTSDQHAWFQRSRRAKPGSPERDFYVWSDTPDRYNDARIIFRDFETSNWAWDPVARAYYWHRFYSHQPDLNFDHPAVREAIFDVTDFWLEMGVDGLRLDAIPYLFERAGTNCENLPETHAFLKDLRAHVDRKFPNRMLLAEANQWPEDAVNYFGNGDECHMAFHFPVMPRLFMALHMEDRFPIVEILRQTPAIPESCQWAIFLRNHDELTLEMVTDAERDYMYRAYAADTDARINLGIRRRLAPLMSNNRRRIELMTSLLFSLPGTPIVYYGDEIGMGDNIFLGDRNGVRTPMQWSSDRNAGFSSANPQRLFLPIIIDPEYHYEAVNVVSQQANPTSLLWWTKRVIALRKRHTALARGDVQFLQPDNRSVLAFLRRREEESVLVVANLSRFAQYVTIDLSEFKDCVPLELFGSRPFGRIGREPYVLTLGPHSFFWFSLQPESAPQRIEDAQRRTVTLAADRDWTHLVSPKTRVLDDRAFRPYLQQCRWYGGKSRTPRAIDIVDSIPIHAEDADLRLVIVRVGYTEGEPERYALWVRFVSGQAYDALASALPEQVIVHVVRDGSEEKGALVDATGDPALASALLKLADRRRTVAGERGRLVGSAARGLRAALRGAQGAVVGRPLGAVQSNTSLLYRDERDQRLLVLKLVRRVEGGLNPDLEICRALTDAGTIEHIAPLAGALEYHDNEVATLGILQRYVPNEGDAWTLMLDTLGALLDTVVTHEKIEFPEPPASFAFDDAAVLPTVIVEHMGPGLEHVRLLGRRTAELHRALGADWVEKSLAPEPLSDFDRRALYQSIGRQIDTAMQLLRKRLGQLPESLQPLASALLERESELRTQVRAVTQHRIVAQRTRIHGDYHLGQVLFTGKDFVVIDFEGEPARPLSERRLKRCPVYDVAGMLRSLQYAASAAAAAEVPTRGVIRTEDRTGLEHAAQAWSAWASAVFLRAYREETRGAAFMPQNRKELELLLRTFLIEKAACELAYELNNRPNWVGIPLRGLVQLLPARLQDAAPSPPDANNQEANR